MNEILINLTKVIPALVIIAALFGYIGWSARGSASKAAPVKATKPAPTSEKSQQQDRAKNLETALEKSRAAHKALKSEFDQLQASSVSKESLEKATSEADAARKALESETKRISALETELKKSQDAIKHLNARANDADKAQKDRSFSLENELSKAREQLALAQNRPNDSAELLVEIERLRESVATSTRFAGELRKREAAAVEALEKAEARLATALETGRDIPAPSKKIGPVGDSDRIAAAKAEVIRLVELNKQNAAAPVESIPQIAGSIPKTAESIPDVVVSVPQIVESIPEVAESVPPVAESIPEIDESAPPTAESIPEITESIPPIAETVPATPDKPPVRVINKSTESGELFALD